MSTTIYNKNGLNIHAFHGGKERGRMLQIETNKHRQFNYVEIQTIVHILQLWQKGITTEWEEGKSDDS